MDAIMELPRNWTQPVALPANLGAWLDNSPSRRRNWDKFAASYRQRAEWIVSRYASFDFAQSLFQAVAKYGYLTERQGAAVERMIDKDAAREVQRAEAVATAPEANMAAVEECFARAKANGVQRPKLRVAGVILSPAPAGGRNPGAIYVKDRGTKEYLGKVADGRFVCSAAGQGRKAEVAEIARDPKAAAIAYGKEYGICSVCGRELSDPESVAAGIGPVCASKYGWAA